MTLPSVTLLDRVRSISFAVLAIITISALLGNVSSNPTGANMVCSADTGLSTALTLGLWVLAITASLGALSATYHLLQPAERYKQALVWAAYLASVPALLLIPSSMSINAVGTLCALSGFYVYLSWYMVGLIALAAMGCIHMLVHGVVHQSRAGNLARTTDSSQPPAAQAIHLQSITNIKQLRAPLSRVRVQIEELLTQESSSDGTQTTSALQAIHDSAREMAVLIETQLDIATTDAGSVPLQTVDLNLRDLVEQICDEQRPAILKKSLILLMRTNLTSQSIVSADRNKVQQVIQILLTEAERTTTRGTITVFVRDDENRTIAVDILDTGAGLTASSLEQVFDPSNAHTIKLRLAQKLAAAMHGTVTAHSAGAGKGSRFTLTLPLEM